MLRVVGWVSTENVPEAWIIVDGVRYDCIPIRTFRPDVEHTTSPTVAAGVVWEFGLSGTASTVDVVVAGATITTIDIAPGEVIEPDYSTLRDTAGVLPRDRVFSVGPPVEAVHPGVGRLLAFLESPVLDLGCGGGGLVRMLRSRGLECEGIEIDRPAIRQALAGEQDITLYDGSFPLPYEDGRFASVVSNQVLEHITDWSTAIAEIARVARYCCIVTVPDASSIPAGFPHYIVPWHLLEASHVNFLPGGPGESHPRPPTDSGREPLDSSGS